MPERKTTCSLKVSLHGASATGSTMTTWTAGAGDRPESEYTVVRLPNGSVELRFLRMTSVGAEQPMLGPPPKPGDVWGTIAKKNGRLIASGMCFNGDVELNASIP
jgi:hypothetical protein